MADNVALITGATGQDGAYLSQLLLSKGYIVHGIKRRSSSLNTARVDHLYQDPHGNEVRLFLHYGDMTDSTNLIRIIQEVQPTEIYNLAAQSHVRVSFETPEYTANADALGTLRLLEAIRILRLENRVRFYQASTSELYGLVQEFRNARPRHFIHGRLTLQPNSMRIGSRSITEKPTRSMLQTVFCSITKGRRAAKHSSPGKSHVRWRQLSLVSRANYSSAISLPHAIGVTPETM